MTDKYDKKILFAEDNKDHVELTLRSLSKSNILNEPPPKEGGTE
ncbi:MAG: hypothetical protein ABII90_08950 [Bacteroidota bacterium]